LQWHCTARRGFVAVALHGGLGLVAVALHGAAPASLQCHCIRPKRTSLQWHCIARRGGMMAS